MTDRSKAVAATSVEVPEDPPNVTPASNTALPAWVAATDSDRCLLPCPRLTTQSSECGRILGRSALVSTPC
jgi:hypothetical protein